MTVASIDIGTNSVRLLIVDAQGRELVRLMHITRLGEGVDQTGRLAPAAITRTLEVLKQYAEELRKHALPPLRMTATSAARDASNRAEFFGPVAECVGQEPELLPGDEEARLSFLGATASLASFTSNSNSQTQSTSPPTYVVFDIGGGSTEFARGVSEPEAYLSLDMGSVRLTERFLLSDPPTAEQLAAARSFVRGLLAQVRTQLPFSGTEHWVGVAGSVTTFAARYCQVTRYTPEVTHGCVLTRQFVRDFTAQLAAASIEQRKALLLEPKRAAVIVGGALILDEVMDCFDLPHVLSSERDILDGLASSLR